jgi:hypothetical protein
MGFLSAIVGETRGEKEDIAYIRIATGDLIMKYGVGLTNTARLLYGSIEMKISIGMFCITV